MRYRNITVSGEIASGTSTLSQQLAKELGWQCINVGKWFREYCRKKGLALEEASLRSDELTREVDLGLKVRLKQEEQLIAEGWLTGYMAQGIEGILKVLLVAPVELRVERFMKREGVNKEEAEIHIQKRTEGNMEKWQRVYGTVDFLKPDLYDVVIDTSCHDAQNALELVMEELDGK